MSFVEFWEEVVTIQICTSSVSLAASLVIVTFIARSGLVTPYRRLIFGLSVSDICQSFAILTAPWLTPADVPQALWGIGNKNTCRFDGFLFLVGMSAVPMYTVALCIYYVCKLKDRMTDAQFAHRIEKIMHITIILTNLILYVSALGLDVINPGFFGSLCLAATVPTGCNQNPEIFGECDPRIHDRSKFFVLVNTTIVPVLCLVSIVWCMGAILWHTLMREKIFGRNLSSSNERSTPNRSSPARRNRRLRSAEASDYSTSYHSVLGNTVALEKPHGASLDTSSLEVREEDYQVSNQNPRQMDPLNDNCVVVDDSEDTKESVQERNENDVEESITSDIPDMAGSQQDTDVGGTFDAKIDLSLLDSHDHSSDNAHGLSQQTRQSTGGGISNHTDPEALSRLYKRELLSQICCYVTVFCLTNMPFLIMNLILINGGLPTNFLTKFTIFTGPLAGLFNIIVYTRWNVRSWRRRHPECWRFQAFWLVIKAGGDLPREDDWNETSAWSFSNLCFGCCPASKDGEVGLPQDRDRDEDIESEPAAQGPELHQNHVSSMSLSDLPPSSRSDYDSSVHSDEKNLKSNTRSADRNDIGSTASEFQLETIPELNFRSIDFKQP